MRLVFELKAMMEVDCTEVRLSELRRRSCRCSLRLCGCTRRS